MSCKMSLEEICSMVESSVFDRKSAKIDAKSLAVHLIAFANADGGTLAIGVEDDGKITGIDGYAENINELLRAPFDFCKPSVQVETERIPCNLLFGKNPKHFFPRARIRFIRYEGTEARVGAAMNVIKDVSFEGRILQVTEKALEFVRSQIKERTYLGADARFVTESEYPEFAWKELIVNAVAHRDYSIKGTDIQIKMFDNRLTVERVRERCPELCG